MVEMNNLLIYHPASQTPPARPLDVVPPLVLGVGQDPITSDRVSRSAGKKDPELRAKNPTGPVASEFKFPESTKLWLNRKRLTEM